MTESSRTLVIVATYNEIENLPTLVEEILKYAPQVDILVVDDNSPDGTGQWCEKQSQQNDKLFCLHREAKLGLGTAAVAGFRYALERDYDLVVTMDADFSHHPRYLPDLIDAMNDEQIDVSIGSRYVDDDRFKGRIEGWPWRRRVMSRLVNAYARLLLGLRVRDCSGAFRCYRASALKSIDLSAIRSRGYSYLEEILWRLKNNGARFRETPIVFTDRRYGQTKINLREAIAAVGVIFRLGVSGFKL